MKNHVIDNDRASLITIKAQYHCFKMTVSSFCGKTLQKALLDFAQTVCIHNSSTAPPDHVPRLQMLSNASFCHKEIDKFPVCTLYSEAVPNIT